MNKGIDRMISTVKSVSKKGSKAVVVALPLVTIGVNVLDAWAQSGGNVAVAGNDFVKRYGAFDIATGQIDTMSLGKGAGSLIVTGIVGKVLSWLM